MISRWRNWLRIFSSLLRSWPMAAMRIRHRRSRSWRGRSMLCGRLLPLRISKSPISHLIYTESVPNYSRRQVRLRDARQIWARMPTISRRWTLLWWKWATHFNRHNGVLPPCNDKAINNNLSSLSYSRNCPLRKHSSHYSWRDSLWRRKKSISRSIRLMKSRERWSTCFRRSPIRRSNWSHWLNSTG